MSPNSRREFLVDVGRGMLVASLGPALVGDLGLGPAVAADGTEALTFGRMEPLVTLMQETPAARLLPLVVEKLKGGADLRTLVAGAALANARTFGGQDYVGYHAFMALAPAYQMAGELPEGRRALPVLKVLYRNTDRIQAVGGRTNEVLHPVQPADLPRDKPGGELLRAATHRCDYQEAERTFAALARGPAEAAFDALQFPVLDDADVHRVVLAWRAWVLLDLAGKEQAHTLLRQSVRYCVDSEKWHAQSHSMPGIRALLPRLLDQYHLLSRAPGERKAEDAWVDELGRTIVSSNRERAAEAVAAALGEGMSPEAVGEAVSLAANQLVLRDPGRPRAVAPNKPKGSVHGDSVGVHASDAVNAWRNIARVSSRRHAVASLIVAGYYAAGHLDVAKREPYPWAEQLAKVRSQEGGRLLREAEAAIKDRDQARACAVVQRYGALGHPVRPVFDLLLRFAISEDGALHAEKYYRTVSEEYAATRPAFRWRQLVALARVTASEYGQPAPGYAEACRLLKV
jgi:hypothetical protein